MAESSVRERGRVADPARLLECVHCGLCLNACPTYLELGTEMDSPRGRIHLIRALEEGSLELGADVVRHLDLCLGCRACETACPSGVRYGSILEEARAFVETNYVRPWWQRLARGAVGAVFPHPGRLRALLAPLRVLQGAGLLDGLRALLPAVALLPPLGRSLRLASFHRAIGTERARVGLLTGCVAREVFSATNEATIRVLNRNGVTVVVPPGQGCCGALYLHSGEPERARATARRNLDAFPSDLDAFVVNAAGCGSAMKEWGALLAADARYAGRARAFSARVRDVNEFLAGLPIAAPERSISRRVTYHDACHLLHGQRIGAEPRALLRSIPGLELIELPESDVCCGSAGSYNLTEPEMARRLQDRKVGHILATGAECVATANPGCALQIRAGLAARGADVRVVHPVELLDEAYAPSPDDRPDPA